MSIFWDTSGRRMLLFRIFCCILSSIFLVSLFFVLVSVYQNPVLPNIKPKIYGFYSNNCVYSQYSLSMNINSLDVLIPDWFHVGSNMELASSVETDIVDIAEVNNVKIMPRVTFQDNEILGKFLKTPEHRRNLINELYNQMLNYRFNGVNIEIGEIDESFNVYFMYFMSELFDLFHYNGFSVTQSIAADDAHDMHVPIQFLDSVIVKLFHEQHRINTPKPIAPYDWYIKMLEGLEIPPEKLVLCLGSFGYEWQQNNNQMPAEVSFDYIMNIAGEPAYEVTWNEAEKNPYLQYTNDKNTNDKTNSFIWFLDAAVFYNQVKLASKYGAEGVAIWRLGKEDPSIWEVISGLKKRKINIDELENILNILPITYKGKGEIFSIDSSGHKGKRALHLDDYGFIGLVQYVSYPKPYIINRSGHTDRKVVVLTFDDGPNPDYTPQIMKILNHYDIKATFFILGINALLNPSLVEQLHVEGHEIGNHTFSHVDFDRISTARLKFELNFTQRLINQITGHGTILLRPPKFVDTKPDVKVLEHIIEAQDMGYITLGASIDSKDWEAASSGEITENILANVSDGHFILLHDAGGNRAMTVEALPHIIEQLQSEGYTFVSMSQFMRMGRERIIPPVHTNKFFLYSIGLVSCVLLFFYRAINILFYITIIIGIIRLLLLVSFSLKQKYRKNTHENTEPVKFEPMVSVIIPAYDEEKVILKTVNSVLSSDYPDYEIIVVDDGSNDGTAEIIKKNFRDISKVKLISKKNEGKAKALNLGIQEAQGDFVITIDADSILAPDAILLLMKHFRNKKVAAVSGNVKVGNISNLLTLCQHIEYVTGFNLERRAYAQLNCITVVPGAVGAWRKQTVIEAGCFNEDTLAEDTDTTLALLRKGYSICYEELAYSYTEAPENAASFIKQRFRWSYGVMQCLWKHRNAFFNRNQKTLGFIALPSMLLFQYILLPLSPIADIFFFIGLISNTKIILFYYLAFFIMDLFSCIYAFWLEKVNIKPLLILFIQRIILRSLLAYVTWKGFLNALKGLPVSWNKFQRTGRVKDPSATQK